MFILQTIGNKAKFLTFKFYTVVLGTTVRVLAATMNV